MILFCVRCGGQRGCSGTRVGRGERESIQGIPMSVLTMVVRKTATVHRSQPFTEALSTIRGCLANVVESCLRDDRLLPCIYADLKHEKRKNIEVSKCLYNE